MKAPANTPGGGPALALYIDGAWRSGGGRTTEPVIDPATERQVGAVPHATARDLDDALAAADRAWPAWRRTSSYDRAAILGRAAAVLRREADRIAARITAEQGKTLTEARNETLNSAEMLGWFADQGRRAYGRLVPSRALHHDLAVHKVPVGPIAAFCAWNAPVQTPMRKIAPALAAGCTIIVKGSEEVPAGLVEIAAAFDEAGLPAGVLNVVYGVPAAISEHLIASPIIRKIAFTGSVPVGKHLASMAAAEMKLATMELGGHSPVFVFDDADPVAVAEAAVKAKFRNAGQICYAPTRFYICDRHYAVFAETLARLAKDLRVGPGDDPTSEIGPLTNARRLAAVEALVADAVARGARLLAGGRRIGVRGFFYEPTVLADVPDSARAMTEEPFGPIAMLNRFGGVEEAVSLANRLEYGLAAYAFTHDRRTALAFLRGIESGTVGINTFQVTVPETPFGGVKDSGIGREGGSEGLEAYLTTKLVSAA
jgi:succinate-semialdehyde dehydrogenase/glutarate-semialdehyde dehydrogenase